MNQSTLKPHLLALGLFITLSYAYFSPLLQGKRLQMSDIQANIGMSKEIDDYRAKTGKEALWTNSMFGGMPAYLISVHYNSNLISYVKRFMMAGLRPASDLTVCLLGFYIALLLFGVSPWLSIAGAIAFSFSSYFFIITEAGHSGKAMAIAFMSPIIAGSYYAYRKKIFTGAAFAALFLALQLSAVHPQITYYTAMIILFLIVVEFYRAIKEKTLKLFLTTTAVLGIAAVLAGASDFSRLWSIYEYSKYSMRGGSELSTSSTNQTKGLDKDYITNWSYGISETFTLLIPGFKGESSHATLSTNSNTYKALQEKGVANPQQIIKQIPLYYGDQPFTSGGVYFGAFVIFLFIFALFIVKDNIKWWLVAATVLSIMLAWGKHFMFLTDLFLEYFPGYNKFRTVAMILVIANYTVPVLGFIGLQQALEGKINKATLINALKLSFYITGGLCLLFALIPGITGDFSGATDSQIGFPDWLITSIIQDRKTLLRADAFRSLIFISLGAGILWLSIKKKIKYNQTVIAIAALILFDLWPVNKRYLNNDDFDTKRNVQQPFRMTTADQQILQDPDPNYRVLNLSANTFNDAGTSYFHKSVGGYHGAKIQRYQDIIENHISNNNMAVLNMLNTRYFIIPQKNGEPIVQRNFGTLGNAWFVQSFKLVANADSEIVALNGFNPAHEAIIDKQFENHLKTKQFTRDSLATISLTSYQPNRLIYASKTTTEQLAIFSEIYYPKGWEVTIDGKEAAHFRANYILRAMIVPAGEHTIEFAFKPKPYYLGGKISLAASSLLIILVCFIIYIEFFKPGKQPVKDSAI